MGGRRPRMDRQPYRESTCIHDCKTKCVFLFKDNAYDPDVSASELWIDKRCINNTECLTFVDNGNGMNHDKLYKMLR